MTASYRVISIGAMSAHPLWNEKGDVRAAHATTTLVTSGDATILVDPSLPANVLEPRLSERANLKLKDITHVFLTSFHPLRRRALTAIEDAEWLLSEAEREAIGISLVTSLKEAHDAADEDLVRTIGHEVAILQRCKAAPDSIAPAVDLFPLPGVSPGACGLILSLTGSTVLICGDAIPTIEHLEQGKVLPQCHDVEQAGASFREAIEVADLLVLGRDNVVLNPVRRPF
jgi:glyoxylase-like metal-dependent hydrolase (beta-lactamase superfamily II)